jgi:hypothetical protein
MGSNHSPLDEQAKETGEKGGLPHSLGSLASVRPEGQGRDCTKRGERDPWDQMTVIKSRRMERRLARFNPSPELMEKTLRHCEETLDDETASTRDKNQAARVVIAAVRSDQTAERIEAADEAAVEGDRRRKQADAIRAAVQALSATSEGRRALLEPVIMASEHLAQQQSSSADPDTRHDKGGR